LAHWEGADFEVVVKKFMPVSREEGFGLLLAKGCDLFALWPPVNKIVLRIFGIHQSDSCLCLIRDVAVMLAQTGFGDRSWLHSCERLKREYRNDNK